MTTYGYLVVGSFVAYVLLSSVNLSALLRSPSAGYSFVESQFRAQAVLFLPAVFLLIMLLIFGSVGFKLAIGLLITSLLLAVVSGLASGSDDRFTRCFATLTIIAPYFVISLLPELMKKYNFAPSRFWYIAAVIVIVLIALKVGRNAQSLTYVVLNVLAGGLMGGLASAVGTKFALQVGGPLQTGSIWLAVLVGAAVLTFVVHLLTMFRPPFPESR